jgi:hypothetical protein
VYSDKSLEPPANLVLDYLDAAAKIDKSASKKFLAKGCLGDMTVFGGFFYQFEPGLRYSATNSRVISVEINTDGTEASVVAGVVLTKGPSIFGLSGFVFHLIQESGAWRISMIEPW